MENPTTNPNARPKWDGQKCAECGHSENLHSNGKGICFAPNCSCDKFIPPKKEGVSEN